MVFLDPLNRFRITGLAGTDGLEDFDEVLGLFLVLSRLGRAGSDLASITTFLSVLRLESARIRLKEGS